MLHLIKKNKNNILLKTSKYSFVFLFALIFASSIFLSNQNNCFADVSDLGFTLENPLGSDVDSVPSVIEKLLKLIFVIGTPLIAVVIIYSGYLYVSSMGDPNKVKHAKEMLLNALIGGALLLGSFVIAELISGTVDQIK